MVLKTSGILERKYTKYIYYFNIRVIPQTCLKKVQKNKNKNFDPKLDNGLLLGAFDTMFNELKF